MEERAAAVPEGGGGGVVGAGEVEEGEEVAEGGLVVDEGGEGGIVVDEGGEGGVVWTLVENFWSCAAHMGELT